MEASFLATHRYTETSYERILKQFLELCVRDRNNKLTTIFLTELKPFLHFQADKCLHLIAEFRSLFLIEYMFCKPRALLHSALPNSELVTLLLLRRERPFLSVQS